MQEVFTAFFVFFLENSNVKFSLKKNFNNESEH
jgi:hypothetical protein